MEKSSGLLNINGSGWESVGAGKSWKEEDTAPAALVSEVESETEPQIFFGRYKNRAFSWRGRKIIKRNLDIISDKNKMDF